jgi:hypothetical protein
VHAADVEQHRHDGEDEGDEFQRRGLEAQEGNGVVHARRGKGQQSIIEARARMRKDGRAAPAHGCDKV